MPTMIQPDTHCPGTTVAELILSNSEGETLAQRKLNPVRGYWIGREPNCDIVMDHPSVSRRHAFVFHANGRWLACDAGSTEGLAVEAGHVRSAPLSADAWVSIGSVYLWLQGAPRQPPDWIDARPETTEAGRAPRLARLAIEDLSDAEPTAVTEVLTLSDARGIVHLCGDLGGVLASKGGGSPRITIGRANTMDLQICHPSVDPLHCVLAVGSQRWSAVDAGCAEGIMWEGKRWFRKRMEDGVVIPVGDFRISMQRVVRTTAPVPQVLIPSSSQGPGEKGRNPARPSAFLNDAPPPAPRGGTDSGSVIRMNDDDDDVIRLDRD